ncbi:hypothetical protein [Nitrolancea hollandica]|uniref:DUF4367 domain-containing protein n=1 Tax=Nitrolancea hollandica Lb TaxID=1129897 RepID=I4EDE1_9BACT|nr:hypothetical protein [Nitrolancea hollandica]CCF82703.1 conserved hypothetical protein [Nitrolancea hollandica Lb]
MSDEQLAHHLREIAEQEVPGDLDLWRAIRAEISEVPSPRPRRSVLARFVPRFEMIRSRTPVLAALSLTVLAVVFGLMSVPSAHGRIDGMLRRFGLALVSSTSVVPSAPQWRDQIDEQLLANGVLISMPSIEEAQRRVPFPIYLPSSLPDGLAMTDIYILTSPPSGPRRSISTAGITYRDGDGRTVFIRETLGASEGSGVPESEVQDARVNGRAALYAQGGWKSEGNAGPALQWDGTMDRKLLSWENGGITYVVDAYGLDLSREDMLRIAESIR